MPFFKVTTTYERDYWAEDEADALGMARYEIPHEDEVQVAEAAPFFPVHDGFMIGDWVCAYAVMVNRSHGRLLSEREDRPSITAAASVESIVNSMGKGAVELEPAAIGYSDGVYSIGLDSPMGRHWIDMRYWLQTFESGLELTVAADNPSMFVLLDGGQPVGAVMGLSLGLSQGKSSILWEALCAN
ncbi:MAG: hypothetical protein H6661_10240 [Ardenticatenaceae bacterium]|nr:hypothetical protein [Ardenticatenaceae bacterium]